MGKSSKKYTKSKRTTKKAAPKTKAKLDTEIKKVVKGMAETKYNMTNAVINTTNITSSTPITQLLNGVAQGVTDVTRIGSTIDAKSIDIRLQFYNAFAFTATSNFCTLVRVMLVREKPALGSPIQLASLMAMPTAIPVSPLNYSARAIKDRYYILYDKCFTVGNQNVNNGQVFVHIKNLKFKTYYRGVGAAFSDIDQNNLSLLIFTDNGQTNALNMNLGYVFEYVDS